MRLLLTIPVVFLAMFSHHGRSPARAQPAGSDGWVTLFDGRTLEGFVKQGGAAEYTVEDHAIVGETRPNTGNTFLCTEQEYADFVLELEVRVDIELNSGVQVRSHTSDEGRVFGYQVEIDPTPRGFSGGIYDEARRGWIAQPTPRQAIDTPFRPGEWNLYRVEARGNRVRTWINGVPVADLLDDTDASGFIGLQVHGVGGRTDPLRVRWRGLRIREFD